MKNMPKVPRRRSDSTGQYVRSLADRECLRCSKVFQPLSYRIAFCSNDCAFQHRRLFDISHEELTSLVWAAPTTKIAAAFGVSDVAIAKRCKLLGVEKPPRGYWAKVAAGKIP